MFKKGICVIVPLFDVTLCLLMLHYSRLTRFPCCLLLLVRGGGGGGGGAGFDLLVHIVSLLVPTLAHASIFTAPTSVSIKPHIT